jgi:hypothetical protein
VLLPFAIVQGMEDVQANFEAVGSQAVSAAYPPGKPPGANVANNNTRSAPSQMMLSTTSVTASGANAVTGTVGYDPNGWISGSVFTVPSGAYKIEFMYQVDYVGAPAVNVTAAAIVNGTGTPLAVTISTTAANQFQIISGSQVVLGPGTFQPAVSNSGVPNVGAQVVNGMWIVTRVN